MKDRKLRGKVIAGLLLLLGLCAWGWNRSFPETVPEEAGPLWINPGTEVLRNGEETAFTERLQAQSACIMDADNFRVLYGKEEQTERKMASTTKIMTCILALELGNLSDVVTVSAHAAGMPDVQLNIRAGEQYRMEDLLYSMMLESHNDSAVAIAEHIGGTEKDFCILMTKKAKDLGAMHTNFETANGLDGENHYTTAVDLARIASYAVKNPDFLKIVGTETRQITEVNGKRSFFLKNIDRYLYMDGDALGIKTGFTGGAGYCFVGATKYKDTILISVVLGSGWPPHKNYKWQDTKALVNFVRKNYDMQEYVIEQKELGSLRVQNGTKQFVKITTEGDVPLRMLAAKEEIAVRYQVPKVLTAPVKSGAVIGYAEVLIDRRTLMTIPVISREDIEEYEFSQDISRLLCKFCP